MMNELYYLQDKRQYVGNDLLFWAKDGKGYTTDVSEAEVYTKEDALKQHNSRETDIPWPKNYIDSHTRPAVDMQYTNIDAALKGSGIKLIKSKPQKKQNYHCNGCGQFMSEYEYYSDRCRNCDTSNWP